ncbi:MAG: phosphatase PAP2 family protein [Flavobacteriales bacterium]|jgi:membrane-associated phospholipid phosphatase|nr:phosphatase PAP2 family protein [Flavobacteriales bacterium]
MKSFWPYFLLFIFLFSIPVCGQESKKRTQKEKPKLNFDLQYKKALVPCALMTLGFTSWVTNTDIKIHKWKKRTFGDFTFKSDDYSQFAPMAGVFAVNALGGKTEHDVWNKSMLSLKSTVLSLGVMAAMKSIINRDRPIASKPSFPSGHTTMAFVSAEVFRQELKNHYPILSYTGYLLAIKTGIFRILNDKHWASDVLFGAGLGILGTRIIYATHQNRWGKWFRLNRKRKNEQSSKVSFHFVPDFFNKGFLLSMTF